MMFFWGGINKYIYSLWVFFLSPHPQPSYLLLAPKALQHGIPTSISVTILIPSPVTVSAHIVHGNLTMASKSVKISDSEPNHWEAYILEVKGHRGKVQVFSSSTKLHLDLEDIATFIQTDKVMYLPGQTVKIRVVSIHSDGKPFISPVDIIIRDPRGNLLRQWLAADSVLGIVSKEFQLSENPPLGQWTIIATLKVSPLAGEPLQGDSVHYCLESNQLLFLFVVLTPVTMSHFSGITYNSTATVSLSKTRYKVSFEEYHKLLRPSLTFSARVRRQHLSEMQSLSCTDNRYSSVNVKKYAIFFSNFVAENIYIQQSATVTGGSPKLSHFQLSKVVCFPVVVTRSFKYSVYCCKQRKKNVCFQLLIRPSLCILCVKVKSRGQVISAGKGSPDLTLVPEVSWAPLACIIVYCVHPSGEVINDAIQLPIRQFLQNQVSLSWSSAVKKPAENVTLNVKLYVYIHVKIKILTVKLPGEITFFGNLHGEQQKERVRWYFPETWIWMDTNTSNSNTKEIALTVPDSITTWIATAFVMSENLGLGIVEQPAELTVFQNFFLSLNLPAFIIRGEELLLEIILFNYLQEDQKVTVTVAQSETFEFVFPDNEQLSMPGVHPVFVKSESGATVLVPIRPLVLGEIPIFVKANSDAVSDSVHTTVLVKAEGLEQSFSTSLLLELSPAWMSLSRNVTFTFPPDVVEGSERASVMAVGDILGPSISGLDSLIQMPYGCGEQNMINFAPNIYVLQYLDATGQDIQKTTEQAINYMMQGYERELTFQRADGSFSAFGEQDSSGSTWLSAFVLRCFLQARPFINIDSNVLHSVAAWIASQQGHDGSFLEPGRVIHTELQGGLDGPVSLTAYVLIALLEDAIDVQKNFLLMYLETHLALGVSSNYSLSLLTYALALAGSSKAQSALNNLTGRAEIRDGVPMWFSLDDGLSSSWQPRSSDIEMASYVLLSHYKLNSIPEGLNLMKWLSKQRNHRGGFGSTQDTVVALQALSMFAARIGSHDTDVTIRKALVKFCRSYLHQVLLTKETIKKLHFSLKLLRDSHSYSVNLVLLFLQLNVFYNVRNKEMRRRRREAGEQEAFELYIELVDSEVNSAHLLVYGVGLNATGMAIMEVGLLSGFSLSPVGIETNDVVKKVETQPGKVILYLDSVSETAEIQRQKLKPLISKPSPPPAGRRMASTYTSQWRSSISSCSLCGDSCSQCNANGDFIPDEAIFNASNRNNVHFNLGGFLPILLLLFVIFEL
uniref:CD109 molecule n=1 Tax=Neolamprologus brichardi TaxID=32507 RepID=A0A3Q4GPP8_NEOBR